MAIAFFTSGDTSPASPASLGIVQSQLYARYAAAVGVAHSGANAANAAMILNRVPARSVRQILFIGHGSSQGFDLVYQRAIFGAGNANLISALEHALANGVSASIQFRCCHVGRAAALISAIQTEFENNSHRATLHATTDFYNIRPSVDRNGQIVRWANQIGAGRSARPSSGTLAPAMAQYPLGRNPAAGRP